MKKTGMLAGVIFLLAGPITPQQQEENIEHIFMRAEKYFKDSKYRQALPLYEKIIKSYGDTLYLKYKMGICALYQPDYYKKAYEYLKAVYEKKPDAQDIEFYLAKAAHLNLKFMEAMEYVMKYLEKPDAPYKKEATLLKSWILNARDLMDNPKAVQIKNIGAPINSEAIEYAPILTADESVIIFTYRGPKSTGGYIDYEYRDDIWISTKMESGVWMPPQPISPLINTPNHESALALSPDGQTLYIYRYTEEDNGDIYVSHLTGNNWTAPEKLKGDVNTPTWEGSLTVSSDGKMIVFSSRRPGGFGGKDLYSAVLMPDSSWSMVTNLGAEINTEWDEDGPFLLPNGKVLIFSSNCEKSMGEMDIFQSEKDSSGNWSVPVNLGYPINTVAEDVFYFVSLRGKGYYSSALKEGYGNYDIYEVFPGLIGNVMPVAIVTGILTVEGKPGGGEIKVTDKKTNELLGNYLANSTSGKYLVILMPGREYRIEYSAEGYTPQYRDFDFTKLDSVVEIKHNVGFSKALSQMFSSNYEEAIKKADEFYKNGKYVDALFYYSIALGMKPADQYALSQIEKIKQLLPEKMISGEKITTGDMKIGLTPSAVSSLTSSGKSGKGIPAGKELFTIQIGAFRDPSASNHWYRIFKEKGYEVYTQKVEFTDVKEKWYRVRIGVFATIEEAIAFARTRLLKENLPDKVVWIDTKQQDNLVIKKSDYPDRPVLPQK